MPRNRENLGKNSGFQDPQYMDDGVDHMWPVPYGKAPNQYRDLKSLAYTSVGAGWPGEYSYEFNFNRLGDRSGEIFAKITVSALTASDGTYIRFVDFAPARMIKSLVISYDTNTLKTLLPEDFLVIYDFDLDHAQRKVEKTRAAIGLTDLELNKRATAAQTFILKIPVDWCDWQKKNPHLNIPWTALPLPIKFTFNMNALAQCIQTDAATAISATITGFTLYSDLWFEIDPKRSALNSVVNSASAAYPEADPNEGLVWKIVKFEKVPQQVIASGVSQVTVDLKSFRNPTIYLLFFIRLQSDTNTNYAVKPWNFVSWSSFVIQDNEEDITATVTLDDDNKIHKPEYFPDTVLNSNIGVWCWAMMGKGNIHHSNGHFSVCRCNTPRLVVNLGFTTAANYVIDVYNVSHNKLDLIKGNFFVRYQ